ncbi:MAG: HdeA/HdeB family chaperone [Steroidobacteraceae bacterium]
MKTLKSLPIASCLALCAGVSTPAFSAPLKPVAMTCAEFLTLDDVVKPKVIFWAEGFSQGGKPSDALVDIGETDTLVPALVTECKEAPQAKLADTIVKQRAATSKATPKAGAVAKPQPAKQPAQLRASMSCAEFVTLDDIVQPKVVYWAEGYSKKGRPIDAVVDVVETDTLVPMLVSECKATPKLTFWEKIKSHF